MLKNHSVPNILQMTFQLTPRSVAPENRDLQGEGMHPIASSWVGGEVLFGMPCSGPNLPVPRTNLREGLQ